MDQQIKVADEISILELATILLRRKWLIIGTTAVAACFAIAFSILSIIMPPEKSFLPNEYMPTALMVINDSSSGSSLSSMLSSSGLGSLASLAGVKTSSTSTYSKLALFLTTTNSFYDAISAKFDIPGRLKTDDAKLMQHQKSAARRFLKDKIKSSIDKDSGVFSISFTDMDPVFAQSVTNYCVEYLEQRFDEMGIDKNKLQKQNLEINIENTYKEILLLGRESQNLEYSLSSGVSNKTASSPMIDAKRIELEMTAKQEVYTQLKTQYELLKVSMASQSPVFQVLEYAEIPEEKAKPSRGRICIIVTLVAFLLSSIAAVVLDAVAKIKKDSAIEGNPTKDSTN